MQKENQSNLYAGKAKVNLGSSLEQIWKATSHLCFKQSFMVPCLKVLEKLFQGFLPYMVIVAILLNRLWPFECFCSPSPRRLIMKYGHNWPHLYTEQSAY